MCDGIRVRAWIEEGGQPYGDERRLRADRHPQGEGWQPGQLQYGPWGETYVDPDPWT